MKPKSLAWFAFAAFSFQMGLAQDFQRSYTIPENGQIFINTSGNIKVLGVKGPKIEVLAYKKGSNPSSIEIEDNSTGNRIDLRLRFPQFHPEKIDPGKADPAKHDPRKFPPRGFPPGGFPPPRFDLGGSSVDFEIRMPKTIKYEITLNTIMGSIEVANISGKLWSRSIRGNVDVKDVYGSITAGSDGGGVRIELAQGKESFDSSFGSKSGDVVVRAPNNLDSSIDMSSGSGRLNTDFPIEIQNRRYGTGQEAKGTLGSGRHKLTIRSIWGSVSLLKK